MDESLISVNSREEGVGGAWKLRLQILIVRAERWSGGEAKGRV